MENTSEPIPRFPYDRILDSLRVIVDGIVDEDFLGQLSTQYVVVFYSRRN